MTKQPFRPGSIEFYVEEPDGSLIPSTLALAEQLSIDSITAFNRGAQYESSEDRAYQTAWAGLEGAIALADMSKLHEAQSSFERIGAKSKNQKYRHDAGTVLDFMPLYGQRVERQKYSPEAMTAVGRALARRALGNVMESKVTQAVSLGSFYQNILFSLCLSEKDPDMIMFPGSVREESNSYEAGGLNHDGYIIRDERKIPVQVKSDKGRGGRTTYDPRVCKFYVRGLLLRSASEAYGRGRWGLHVDPGTKKYQLPRNKMTALYGLTSRLLAREVVIEGDDADYVHILQTRARGRIDAFYDSQLG